MSLATVNQVTCVLIAALCIWAELSKHTTSSVLLSLGRGTLAITALVEASGYFSDPALAIPQVLMNASMAFLLCVLFYNTQMAVLRKHAEHRRRSVWQALHFWQ